jgi:hypothetical protein
LTAYSTISMDLEDSSISFREVEDSSSDINDVKEVRNLTNFQVLINRFHIT